MAPRHGHFVKPATFWIHSMFRAVSRIVVVWILREVLKPTCPVCVRNLQRKGGSQRSMLDQQEHIISIDQMIKSRPYDEQWTRWRHILLEMCHLQQPIEEAPRKKDGEEPFQDLKSIKKLVDQMWLLLFELVSRSIQNFIAHAALIFCTMDKASQVQPVIIGIVFSNGFCSLQ